MIEIPEQRWALPVDSDRDKYEYEYEHWLSENYDDASQSIMGRHMTWEQACEDEHLFDDFMDEVRYQQMP
jgi:hypothetical protein